MLYNTYWDIHQQRYSAIDGCAHDQGHTHSLTSKSCDMACDRDLRSWPGSCWHTLNKLPQLACISLCLEQPYRKQLKDPKKIVCKINFLVKK